MAESNLSRKELEEIRERTRAKRQAREMASQGLSPSSVPGGLMAPRGPENPEEVGQMIGELGGSLIGGPAGGRILGPIGGRVLGKGLGNVLGRTLGAGAGSAAGNQVAGGNDPGMAALRGSGGELGGLGIAAGLQKLAPLAAKIPGIGRLVSPVQKSVLPFAREADTALGGGGTGIFAGQSGLGVGQAIENDVMKTLTTVADTTVVGSSRLGAQARRAGEGAADIAQKFVDNLIEADPSKVVRGEVIDQAIRGANDTFHQVARARYAALDTFTQNPAVSITALKDAAAEQGKRVGGMQGGRGEVIRTILAEADQIPFARAQELRSYLLGIGRTTDPNPEAAERVARILSKSADDAMDEAATSLSPRAQQAWRDTNAWYRRGSERFNNDIIKRVLRRDAESVVDTIVGGGGKPETVQRVLEAVGHDPVARKTIRDHLLARVIQETSSGEQLFLEPGRTGAIKGADFVKKLSRYSRETLGQLFTPQEFQGIRTIAAALDRGQRGATGAEGAQRLLGTWGFYLTQVAGAGGIGTGIYLGDPVKVAGGTMLLLSPKALGWFLTNPQTRRWLIHGASIPPGTVAASRVTGNLLSQARRAQRMFGEDAVQIQRGGQPSQPQAPYRPPQGPMSFADQLSPDELSALRGGR